VLNDASDGIALIPAALAGRALKSRDKVGESQILTASCGANPAGRQLRGGNLLGLATEGLIASQTSPYRAVLGDSLHHCAPLVSISGLVACAATTGAQTGGRWPHGRYRKAKRPCTAGGSFHTAAANPRPSFNPAPSGADARGGSRLEASSNRSGGGVVSACRGPYGRLESCGRSNHRCCSSTCDHSARALI
jgi:hypothetical protein